MQTFADARRIVLVLSLTTILAALVVLLWGRHSERP